MAPSVSFTGQSRHKFKACPLCIKTILVSLQGRVRAFAAESKQLVSRWLNFLNGNLIPWAAFLDRLDIVLIERAS